jgi:cytochrome c heme-lyase
MEMLKKRRRDVGYDSGKAVEEEGPRLLRFMGRPGDRTPKATIMQALGWVFPE